MKRKIFLGVLMVMALVCLMAVTAFAAEPNSNGEKVTLGDGTELPIWDTDGDALIWYKSSANTNDGYASYDYVKAQSSEVSYFGTNWAGLINGVQAYQTSTITITVDGASYGKNDIVVFNIKDEDVLVTTNNSIGKPVNCLESSFNNSKSIEYVFLRTDTVAMQAGVFSGCSNLKYVNFTDLTQLNQIIGQNFNGCTSLFAGETIDLSNTKLTGINNGTFGFVPAKRLLLPSTLTKLDNWCLQNMTGLEEFHIPETVTSFGNTMFNGCTSLKEVTGYKALFERGVIDKIQDTTFMNCKSLVSVDFPDTYSSIGGSAFRGMSSYKGTFVVSNECTSIGSTAFQDSGFDTIVVGTGVKTISSNAFRASQLKFVFISPNVTAIQQEAFRDMKNKVVVYYTGDNAEDLKSITVNSYNGVICDASTVCVSADSFDVENREDKNYIVYGYDNCEAFFGGHKMSENTEMKFTSYFEAIKFASVCTNEGCDHAGYDESKTIGAIFKNYGYSMTEVKIGGKLSMSQFFGIDDDNLKKYTDLTGESFEYGIVVSSNADPLNEANAGLIEAGKTHITKEDKIAHDYIVVSVAGFVTEGEGANADKGLAFCMFVKDGEKTSYLDNGKTVTAVELKSYNTIKAMLENN